MALADLRFTIFGTPKVHYIIILNSLERPDLLQESPCFYHFGQLLPFVRPGGRPIFKPLPEILQLFHTGDLGKNSHTLQSGCNSLLVRYLKAGLQWKYITRVIVQQPKIMQAVIAIESTHPFTILI